MVQFVRVQDASILRLGLFSNFAFISSAKSFSGGVLLRLRLTQRKHISYDLSNVSKGLQLSRTVPFRITVDDRAELMLSSY